MIHLDCSKLASYFESLSFDPSVAPKPSTKFKNVISKEDQELRQLALIDPLAVILAKLRKQYGHLCLFFADSYGGDKIGGVFKDVFGAQKFKVNPGVNSKVFGDGIIGDKESTLAEFSRVCGNIAIGIELF